MSRQMAVEYLLGCITAASKAGSTTTPEESKRIVDHGTACLIALGVDELEIILGIMGVVGDIEQLTFARRAAEAVKTKKEGQSSAKG